MKQDRVNGSTLTLARKMMNIAQDELGEIMGVAQGTISKIENNELDVEKSSLNRLAEKTGLAVSFFYQKDFYQQPCLSVQFSKNCFNKKRQYTPRKTKTEQP